MWLMPGSLLASIEASLFSLGADDDGISIGERAGRATGQAEARCEAIENENETDRARCAGGVALVILISSPNPGSFFVTLVGLGPSPKYRYKVSVHSPTPVRLSSRSARTNLHTAQYCCSSACPSRGEYPNIFCLFLALLVPCARSLDPFLHPSLFNARRRTGLSCHAGRVHRERDEVASWSLAASIYRDSPSGFLIVSGHGDPGHIPRNLVAITKPVGCGKRASGRTHHLFPTGRGAHTHTRPRPASQPASLRVGTSSWPRQWGCGEARAHLFELRRQSSQKMPAKCSPNRLLLPLRWPSAGVYS